MPDLLCTSDMDTARCQLRFKHLHYSPEMFGENPEMLTKRSVRLLWGWRILALAGSIAWHYAVTILLSYIFDMARFKRKEDGCVLWAAPISFIGSNYWVIKTRSMMSLDVVPGILLESSNTLSRSTAVMACSCLEIPRPKRYLTSSSPSAFFTCRIFSASA